MYVKSCLQKLISVDKLLVQDGLGVSLLHPIGHKGGRVGVQK